MSWWREPGAARGAIVLRHASSPRAVFVLLATLALSACGFQLRGEFRVPEALVPIYIDADRDSDVADELRRQLRRSNVGLAAERTDAASVIDIVEESRRRRVLTRSAETANVDEYELNYATSWLLRDTGEVNRPLSNLEHIEIIRDYTHDRGAILAKQSEEADLFDRMLEDAALRILYRIQAWNPELVPEPADVEAQLEKQSED